METEKHVAVTTPAVRMAFKSMPNVFYITQLINEVRKTGLLQRIKGAKMVMSLDSSILRILRRERGKNPQEFGYTVIDRNKSLYKKSCC